MNDAHELSVLIARLSDGELTEQERQRLCELLKTDPAAQEAYLDHMALDAHLEREYGQSFEPQFDVVEVPRWRFNRFGWVAAAAGLVVLLALVAMFHWPTDHTTALARVTDVVEPVWADEFAAPALGSSLGPMSLKLQSGTVEFTFESGVVLTLTGPAELELINRQQVRLPHGRVVSYVPPAAHGFTILSPEGNVVDLGTEFALDVDRGRSKVQVLAGKVRVESVMHQIHPSTQLTTGYAAQLQESAAAHITQVPLFLDAFETVSGSALNLNIGRRQSGGRIQAEYENLNPDAPSEIRNGMLVIPFAGQVTERPAMAGVKLARDLHELVGRRYTITFKLLLPDMGSMIAGGWAAFVLWDGEGERSFPVAFSPSANLSILLSPRWQVGVRLDGQVPLHVPKNRRVFARTQPTGVYRVVLAVDESAVGESRADLTVNGVPVVADLPVTLGKRHFMGFQTWTARGSGEHGTAKVNDLCVSVEAKQAAHR